MSSMLMSRVVALRTRYITFVATFFASMLVSGHGFKNEIYNMCSMLVLGHGIKSKVYCMCSVLVLGLG